MPTGITVEQHVDAKNVPIDGATFPRYEPSDAERKAVDFVWSRLHTMNVGFLKKYSLLNDRSITEYEDDCVKRFNGYIPPNDEFMEEWQIKIFNNFTRTVLINFLSETALSPAKVKIRATNESGQLDKKRSFVLEKLNEFSDNNEQGEWKNFFHALNIAVKGTGYRYEGYLRSQRAVKDILFFDPATGKLKTEEKTIVDFDDCYAVDVPLKEIRLGNMFEFEIQKQPDMIWRSLVEYRAAQAEFRKYKNWKYVQPGNYSQEWTSQPFFDQEQFTHLEASQVHIIRYYNRPLDRMVIVANGVVLYDGPFPWVHKKYPFGKGIFEPLASNFALGKSMVDKSATDQDVINILWEMMINQGLLGIYKPILTDDPDEMEDSILIPGLVKKVGNKDSFRVLSELTGPDASSFNLLQMALKFANDNSGYAGGAAALSTPKGGKMTARQIMLAEEKTRKILGLNVKFLEKLRADAVDLRLKNILQFYTKARVRDVAGDEAGKMYPGIFYKHIKVSDTTLSDNTRGDVEIRITDTLPEPIGVEEQTGEPFTELDVEEEMAALQGQNLEIKAVLPDYIRNVQFDVTVVSDSSYQQSRSLKQAQGEEYILNRVKFFPQLTNMEQAARRFDEIYGEDSDRMMATQEQPTPEMLAAAGVGSPARGESGQAPPLSTQILKNEQKSLSGMADV